MKAAGRPCGEKTERTKIDEEDGDKAEDNDHETREETKEDKRTGRQTGRGGGWGKGELRGGDVPSRRVSPWTLLSYEGGFHSRWPQRRGEEGEVFFFPSLHWSRCPYMGKPLSSWGAVLLYALVCGMTSQLINKNGGLAGRVGRCTYMVKPPGVFPERFVRAVGEGEQVHLYGEATRMYWGALCQAGGAGAALLQFDGTGLVWIGKSRVLPKCADNIVAEVQGADLAMHLYEKYVAMCHEQGLALLPLSRIYGDINCYTTLTSVVALGGLISLRLSTLSIAYRVGDLRSR